MKAKAEAHAKAHAERRAAEEAAKAQTSGKKTSGCPGVGQRLPMGDKEKLTRRAQCPGCKKELKIKDGNIDMSGEPLAFVVPKHRIEVAEAPPQQTTMPVVASTPAAPVVAAAPVESVPPPIPPLPSTPPVVQVFNITNTAPPPIPELPQMTFAPEIPIVGTVGSADFIDPVVADKRYFARSTLFLNIVFVRGESPKNLDEYARDLIKTLTTSAKVDDLRYAPDGHELGFGRWKGALAKMVKANPLPPGEYVLQVHSEARQEIAEAVADMLDARVVRGAQ